MPIERFIVIYIIRLYRIIFLSWRMSCCRFIPTCSQYAILVIRDYGLIKGGTMALKRLLRCHPLGGFGVDYPPSHCRKVKK